MNRRENTFRLNYANMPKKPSLNDILSFCGKELELGEGELIRVQCSRTFGCAFVTTINLETAQRVCEKHDNKHEVVIDGKKYPLRITMEDGAVEVKITDLSESVSNEKIKTFLTPYGDVIDIKEQNYSHPIFSNILTGVRIVKMVVKRNIDSFVTIDGETTMVSYYGQRQTCRYCREFNHGGVTCAQNKKLLVQKSYADAIKTPAQAKPRQVSVATTAKTSTQSVHRTTKTGEKPSVKSSATKPTAEGEGTNAAVMQRTDAEKMPPPSVNLSSQESFPALPIPPTEGSASTRGLGQRPTTSRSKDRQTDGNETDDSTTSSDSTRRRLRPPAGKKPKHESSNEEKDDCQQ